MVRAILWSGEYRVDLTCALPAPRAEGDAFTFTERLALAYAVVALGGDGGRLELSMTVEAPTAVAAATRARGIVYGLELAEIDTIPVLEIRTEAERARQLAEPEVPALVGTAEIGKLAGVSRQQVFNLALQEGFPVPVQKISG